MTLNKNPRHPVILIILDGFGVNPSRKNNAVVLAETPRLDDYFGNYPHTLLQASGPAVGLPDGQMGNSEVGHLTLGCGAVIRQDLVLIDSAIADGSFYQNAALCNAMKHALRQSRPLHIIGLVSEGGVHSHIRHLLALLKLCQRKGVKPLLHVITDGRDAAPHAAINLVNQIESAIKSANGEIATVCGRFFAMDRDRRWDRIHAAWHMMVNNQGRRAASLKDAIQGAYAAGESDEFIQPTVLPGALPFVQQDAAVFFNFRKDRPRQLTAALTKQDFREFNREDFSPMTVTCMTEYDKWFDLPYAFEQDRPLCTLAEIVSDAGLSQFHCAETEKYAHVTYFFNGGRGERFSGEDRVIIPSPAVTTYDESPAMSAELVADTVIDAVRSKKYAFIVVNFANGDMVGHTANQQAILQSLAVLDTQVGRVLDTALKERFSVILTADHGNCDEMIDPITGDPHTQHTVYPVPCLIIDEIQWQLSIGRGLDSVAPTALQLLMLNQPEAMTGRSLLLRPINM